MRFYQTVLNFPRQSHVDHCSHGLSKSIVSEDGHINHLLSGCSSQYNCDLANFGAKLKKYFQNIFR